MQNLLKHAVNKNKAAITKPKKCRETTHDLSNKKYSNGHKADYQVSLSCQCLLL